MFASLHDTGVVVTSNTLTLASTTLEINLSPAVADVKQKLYAAGSDRCTK